MTRSKEIFLTTPRPKEIFVTTPLPAHAPSAAQFLYWPPPGRSGDDAPAAQFLKEVRRLLENPVALFV